MSRPLRRPARVAAVWAAAGWALLLSGTAACSRKDEPPLQAPAAAAAPAARFALSYELAGFDPLAADETAAQVLQRQVYEGLLEHAPGAEPWRQEPLLAESWEGSPDGLQWIFHLRRDARFYDPSERPLWPGRRRPVTARDVVDSWLRLADARNDAPGWFALQGLIAGLDQFHDATAGASQAAEAAWEAARRDGLAGLRALDDQLLEVRLTRPTSDWLARLASAYTVVYPREAWERPDRPLVNHPVGSGPYYLEHWTAGHEARFRRVPEWRGGGQPQIESVTFTAVLEGATRTLLFEKGEIDRLSPGQDAFAELITGERLAPELAERGVQLLATDVPDLTMLCFNMDDPVVGQRNGDAAGNARRRALRRAIAQAFPYERWARVVRAGGWGQPARNFLVPGLPEREVVADCPWRASDGAAVARLLEEAGYPGGAGLPALTLELSGPDAVTLGAGEIIVEALAQAGIPCATQPNSYAEFTAKTQQRRAQMFLRSWLLDWPDGANLFEIFHGPNGSPGVNRCNFADPGYDALFVQYCAVAPGPERRVLAQKMVEILNGELPALPIDHRRGYLLVHPWLRNVSANPYDPFPCKRFRVEGRP